MAETHTHWSNGDRKPGLLPSISVVLKVAQNHPGEGGGGALLAIYGSQPSEYPEGILAVLSTQLKKHLEECSSIRTGIMGPLTAHFVNTEQMSS